MVVDSKCCLRANGCVAVSEGKLKPDPNRHDNYFDEIGATYPVCRREGVVGKRKVAAAAGLHNPGFPSTAGVRCFDPTRPRALIQWSGHELRLGTLVGCSFVSMWKFTLTLHRRGVPSFMVSSFRLCRFTVNRKTVRRARGKWQARCIVSAG